MRDSRKLNETDFVFVLPHDPCWCSGEESDNAQKTPWDLICGRGNDQVYVCHTLDVLEKEIEANYEHLMHVKDAKLIEVSDAASIVFLTGWILCVARSMDCQSSVKQSTR